MWEAERNFPWEAGQLIRMRRKAGVPAFNPNGATRETRTVTVPENAIVMFLGLTSYGRPNYNSPKDGFPDNIVMEVLYNETKYLIRVHDEWTYEQFEKVGKSDD